MAEVKKHYDEYQKYNTQIFALSVDTPEKSNPLKKDMKLPFELLCDVEKKVIKRYGLLNPYEHGGIAYPAVFIIRPDGKIGYRSLDGTAKRVDISETIEFIKKLKEDPEHETHSQSKKKWIFPSPINSIKAIKNIFFTSTLKDYTYLLLTPFVLLKMVGTKLKR